MRKILISIKPKWTAKILNGEKTIEVRKTAPKCELPCEVYIYCTKGKPYLTRHCFDGKYHKGNCLGTYDGVQNNEPLNGKVIAKFTLNDIEDIYCETIGGFGYYSTKTFSNLKLQRYSCVGEKEMDKYLKGKNGYAWYIDDLVIFDKPKGLKDFGVKRSPQSWQYMEVDE